MSDNDPNMVLQDLEKAKQSFSSGNYAVAEPLLRDVFEKLDSHPLERAYVSECLSEIYTAWGKFSEAIRLNQRLINLTAANPAQSLAALSGALERIAAVSLKVGKKEQSDKLNRLAAAVKAGKIDVKTLVTEKAKVPMAPPTTEHTYTFKALGPDSPPPEPSSPDQSSAPAAPAAPAVQSSPDVPPASTPSANFSIPSNYAVPTAPVVPPANQQSPDVLARPTKETAMFSRPSMPKSLDADVTQAQPPSASVPPAPASVPPFPAPPVPASQGEIPDYQLADFDEEITISAPPATPHADAPVVTPQSETPQSIAETFEPPPELWGPPESTPEDSATAQQEASTPADGADIWGAPSSESAEVHDEWGPAEPSEVSPADTWGAPELPVQPPARQWQHPATISQTAAALKLQSAQTPAPQETPSNPDTVESPRQIGESSILEEQPPEVEEQSFSASDLQSVVSQTLSSQSLPSQSAPAQSASSVRSMRSMSSRNMAAPPMAGAPDMGGLIGMIAQFFVGKRDPDQPVQELVDPSTTSAKAAAAMVVMVSIVVGLAYVAYHMPRKLSPADAYRAIQHKYVSTDSTKSLVLTDPTSCEFAVGEKKMPAKLRFYLDDWRDAVDMSLGRVGEKQIWLVRTGDGIVDEDQIKLYVNGGAELQLASRIDFLNQYATMQFQKVKSYPARGNLNPAIDLRYLNPYTKKREMPLFFKVVIGKGLASHEADQARTKFYDALLSGQVAPETPKANPGEIRCYAVDFLSPRGTIEGFVVQLIGKDGKPLSGVRPHSSYLFALEDGKEYKPTEAGVLPFNGEPGLRPAVVWLLMDKLDETFVLILSSAPVIIFTIMTFVFLILSFVVPRGLGRAVSVLLLVLSAIPALLFCLVKVLP